MILFILPLIALAANNLIGGIDYLFKLLFPPVPSTVPLSQPYTPPFTGGQCLVQYRITFLRIVLLERHFDAVKAMNREQSIDFDLEHISV